MADAERILSGAGFEYLEQASTYPMCWTREDVGLVCLFRELGADEGSIKAVEINPHHLTLGEAMILFGAPVSARLCWLSTFMSLYPGAESTFQTMRLPLPTNRLVRQSRCI